MVIDPFVVKAAIRRARALGTPDGNAIASMLSQQLAAQNSGGIQRGSASSKRGDKVPYHYYRPSNLPVALAATQTSSSVQLLWSTVGRRVRVLAMSGYEQSGLPANMCNTSLRLESNGNESLITTGVASTFGTFAGLFPAAEPWFSFVTPSRPKGILVTPSEQWTLTIKNEFASVTTVSPEVIFLVVADDDDPSPADGDEAYGARLGVHVFRTDSVPGVTQATSAFNPSAPLTLKFSTGHTQQRIVAWTGSVNTASAADMANMSVDVQPNAAEHMGTDGQKANFIPFAALFGTINGMPARWSPFLSRSKRGMPVAPDEFWSFLFQNENNGSTGTIVPSVHLRVEHD